jgi:hypothetical protein
MRFWKKEGKFKSYTPEDLFTNSRNANRDYQIGPMPIYRPWYVNLSQDGNLLQLTTAEDEVITFSMETGEILHRTSVWWGRLWTGLIVLCVLASVLIPIVILRRRARIREASDTTVPMGIFVSQTFPTSPPHSNS